MKLGRGWWPEPCRSRSRSPLVWRQARLLLLAIQAERRQKRDVLERKEDRRVLSLVGVLVSGGRGDDEEVSLFPFMADPVDHGAAGAADHMVDGAARLAVGPGVDPGADHLEVASDGRENGAAGGGVDVFQEHIVERVRLHFGKLEQRGVRGLPPVVDEPLWPRARGRSDRAESCGAEAALGQPNNLPDRLGVFGM